MPEIPEIASRAVEMNAALAGKSIREVEIKQDKCLNLPSEQFRNSLLGAVLLHSRHHGKWIFSETTSGWLLINLGMGGEIFLTQKDTLPPKYRLFFEFSDTSILSVNFWWFGYVHFVPQDQLGQHEMTAKLGPDVLEISEKDFTQLISRQKGKVKNVLLDQTKVAGIGNFYIHDILFRAGLHPLRAIPSLKPSEIHNLYQAIQQGLIPALNKGGAFYELNLYGEKGGFLEKDILVGYREGQPCPKCQTPIQKIRTGGTSSFICPNCQHE